MVSVAVRAAVDLMVLGARGRCLSTRRNSAEAAPNHCAYDSSEVDLPMLQDSTLLDSAWFGRPLIDALAARSTKVDFDDHAVCIDRRVCIRRFDLPRPTTALNCYARVGRLREGPADSRPLLPSPHSIQSLSRRGNSDRVAPARAR